MSRIAGTLIASVCLIVGLAAFAPRLIAQDPKPEPVAPPQSALTASEVNGLIQELDAPEFDVREQATKKLAAGGQTVIEPVAKAAETDSLEVSTRCIAVLKELHQSNDAATKAAAQGALKQLAESKNRSVARRAKEVLTPPTASSRSTRTPARLPVGQAVSISSRTANGRTDITVRTGETTISISHESGKNIVVKVQEPAAEKGKAPAVKEYKAKDLAELKEKHPDAHAQYEKYANQVRTINFGNLAIAARPAAPAVPDANLPPETRQAMQELQTARSELLKLYSKVGTLSRRTDVKQDELKLVLDELKAVTDRIAAAQKKLPK